MPTLPVSDARRTRFARPVAQNGDMQLTARHEFADTCDRVYAMSIDPAFLAQTCVDLGGTDSTEEVLPDGGGATTRITARVAPPPQMAKLVGASIPIEQTMTWGDASADGSRQARLSVRVVGFPVEMDADARLAPTASGCAVDYEGTITVKIPVLGPVLEQQAAPFILETLDNQQRAGDNWLAAHR